MSEFPEDEFDVAGRERSADGVHREPQPLLRALLPYLLVIIVLVPLLAWGAVGLISGPDEDDDVPQATAPPTEQVEPNGDEPPVEETDPPADTEEPTEETTESPTELGGDVIQTASISVLNGAGIGGLAGENAALLEEAGFTTVIAADYGAASPEITTIYYREAELEPTAEAIGDILGITNLVELASAAQNVEIAVVLRPDFA